MSNVTAWAGARTNNSDKQAYYNSEELANQVVKIAKRYSDRGSSFVELGVGDGAIYNRLPEPKQGVELQRLSSKLRGVEYGKDALKWQSSMRKPIVVMNPPFSKQIAFFNHAATFSDVIVWIAGLICIASRRHLLNA